MPAQVTLNGYSVTFLGAQSTAAGTEFSYSVTGVDPGPPALDWFFLENACGAAPLSVVPANAVNPAATANGLPGVKWTASVPAGTARTYAYTFADADLGVVQATIRRGGVLQTASLPGPCGGYRLDGSVFVDGDAGGDRSAEELGIGNVRVEVYDDATFVAAETTAPDGSFAFLLAGGTYEVRIPAAATGAFNATLYDSYTAFGGVEPTHRSVSLSSDVADVVFGFTPDGDKIVNDLTTGAFQTQAREVRFWQQTVRRAARGARCDTADPEVVCGAQLASLLAQIFSGDGDAAYLLDDPYQLPAGASPLDQAAELLAKPVKTELEVVTRNLFAMELNRLNGWGTPDPAYDDALMAYLEGWVARGGTGAAGASVQVAAAIGPGGGGGGGGGVEESMTRAYLGGGGGGGGVEE